jgi:PAS domain S-box-containing protein
MSIPLRVLFVMDSADEADAMALEFRSGGYDVSSERVTTVEEMRAALGRGWDIVFASRSLRRFSPEAALELSNEMGLDLPFVVAPKSGLVGVLPPAVRGAADGRLAALLAMSADALIGVTLGGVVTDWNPAAERLYGWASGEVVGRSLSFLLPADRAGESTRLLERTRRGESLESFETVRIRKDGTPLHVSLTSSPIRTAGVVVGAFVMARDLGERQRAEADFRASEVRYRTLLERIPMPLFVYDRETLAYLAVNDAAVANYGYSREEFFRMKLTDIRPAEDIPALLGLLARSGPHFEGRGVWRHRKKDGTLIEVDITAHEVDLGGRPACIVLAHDVTERRRIEAERNRTADLLRVVADGTIDAVFVKDRDGRYLLFNEAAARFVGLPVEDVLGKDDTALFDPESAGKVMARDRRVIETGEVETEVERLTAAGVTRTYWATKAPYRDSRGAVIGVIGISRDITEQKRAADALQASEERFRAFMDHSPAAAWVTDADGRIVYLSAAYRRLFLLPPGEAVGRSASELFPEHIAQTYCNNIREVARSGRVLEANEPGIRPDGTPGEFLVYKFPLPQADGGTLIGGVAVDVTDRKRAEAERDTLLTQLRLQIERMPLAYLLTGADLRYTRWNHAAERMFGFAEAEVLGKHPFEVVVPPASQDFVAGVFDRLRAGDMNAHGVSENITRDGRITCEWYNTPLMDEHGTFTGLLSLAQDITVRREAGEKLRLRDRAIQAVTQGIFITDAEPPDYPIFYASPGFERMTGYTQEEVLGKNWRFLQGKDTDPEAVALVRKAVHEGRPCTVELLEYRKDGSPFWNELSISPVLDAEGRLAHFIGVQTDVTERRLLEAQYHQAQKMEAVGQLAGGIAHDFNNLLTIINGYSELVLSQMWPGDPNLELVAQIHRAGERSAALTRQLLVFSRKQVVAPRVLDLGAVVADAEKMLRRMIGEDVRLETKLGSRQVLVRADPGQLEQVLMNLTVNARDAMPRGGRLAIATAAVELDADHTRVRVGARLGPYALLTVSDTGGGMTPEVMARIWEPFYTTKGVGNGSGLGLAVVHGIVEQAGGFIVVESTPGVGTTFDIYLPAVEGSAEFHRGSADPRLPPRGNETVLLVEDEDGVRTLTRHVLADRGYLVLEASDGEEALGVASRHPGPIHLLLTDVVMPGMGGRELADRIAALRPEAKVLYVSGYTDDAIVRHGVLEEQVSFLQKPFSTIALASKVREVLDG